MQFDLFGLTKNCIVKASKGNKPVCLPVWVVCSSLTSAIRACTQKIGRNQTKSNQSNYKSDCPIQALEKLREENSANSNYSNSVFSKKVNFSNE